MKVVKYIPNFNRHDIFVRLEWESRIWYMPWKKRKWYMEVVGFSTVWYFYPEGKMCHTLTITRIIQALKKYEFEQLANKEQSND